jgi:hypothetical protein
VRMALLTLLKEVLQEPDVTTWNTFPSSCWGRRNGTSAYAKVPARLWRWPWVWNHKPRCPDTGQKNALGAYATI